MISQNFMSYFTMIPGFDYDAIAPISIEFGRLAETRDWSRGSKARRINWHLCMVSEYQILIGTHANELATWQGVCKKAGLEDDSTSIAQCEKALDHIHLNIVGLTESWATDNVPRRFSNGRDLAKYSMSIGKVYPRDAAKKDPILRVLQKQLL